MSPAVVQLIFQLIAQLITEAPALIADVEKLLAAAKGQAPASPSEPPLAPQVESDMAGPLQNLVNDAAK